MSKRVVILSAFQDYRTKKRASIQQVADGLVAEGYDVSFISTRFSMLSRLTGDSRLFLDDRSNRVDRVNGIDCYLWKTPLHPISLRQPWLDALTAPLFDIYSHWPNRQVDTMLSTADFVIVESSIAVIYLPRISRLNPEASIIYYATDRLDTVGAHPKVQSMLVQHQSSLNHLCLRSSKMVPHFDWASAPLYLAEFGIQPQDFENIGASPYSASINFVSVGSMLFDPTVFAVADRFPDCEFHVIGCGQPFEAPTNVIIYSEMSFKDTLPYMMHATVGMAPYRWAPGCEYLDESSLKLAQFDYFGIPAICPDFAVGTSTSRSGYICGNLESITAALRQAVSRVNQVERKQFENWGTVAKKIVEPDRFGAIQIS